MPSDSIAADVLIVERDQATGREIHAYLHNHGYGVEWVDESEKAYNRLDLRPFDVLVTELSTHRIDGMRLMAVALDRNPEICVILIAGHPDVERATEAMRQGAYDFQTKPLNLGKLDAVIQRGLGRQRLILEQYELKRRLDEQFGLGSLIGRSPQMIKTYNTIRQIGPTHTPVLILGEPGVGKDLVAQAIHNISPRRDAAFVKLNCSNLPQTLIESELFGHMPGAFPGASDARQGRIELADSGSLFIDDIIGLPLHIQAKLLTVLQQGRTQRLGSNHSTSVNFRLIAAAQRPIDPLVEPGSFNADLFAMIRHTLIDIPPLRMRRDDIPLLADHFLREACASCNRKIDGISRSALDILIRYDWPGNVRELRNAIEGMALMARPGHLIDINDIPVYLRRGVSPEVGEIRIPTGTPMHKVEQLVIEETLKASGYNKEACAKTLGIGLRTLYRKLKEYDIH